MPIDTPFVRALVAELNRTAAGARIDKVFMPAPDEVVLALRAPSVKTRLLLSANSRMPRAYFTAESRENPPTPPMFCMLLRKHLAGGKITEIRQPVYDRVIELLVNGYNEMGDPVKKRLVLEITGSTSNLILIDGENRILDAVKHTDITTLNGRPVLPGLEYRYPPVPEKVNPFDTEALHMLLQEDSVEPLDKFLFGRIAGMSPLSDGSSRTGSETVRSTNLMPLRLNGRSTRSFRRCSAGKFSRCCCGIRKGCRSI